MKEYRSTKDWMYHVSAGGTVYKIENDTVFVLVLYRDGPDGRHYHLPKGTLHYEETLEDCARREVEEESGTQAEIRGYLGAHTAEYFHPRDQFRYNKTTHYFAMEFINMVREHDSEHTGVEWLSIDDAHVKLSETEPLKEEFLIIDRLKEFLTKFGGEK